MNLDNSEQLGEFVHTGVWLLGALWIIIQIVKSLRRSPPMEAEFANKSESVACQQRCATYRAKSDAENVRRDKDSSDSRARLYGLIEELRQDMDSGMRELGQQTAALEVKTDMINQRQIQMDSKIDALLRR